MAGDEHAFSSTRPLAQGFVLIYSGVGQSLGFIVFMVPCVQLKLKIPLVIASVFSTDEFDSGSCLNVSASLGFWVLPLPNKDQSLAAILAAFYWQFTLSMLAWWWEKTAFPYFLIQVPGSGQQPAQVLQASPATELDITDISIPLLGKMLFFCFLPTDSVDFHE